MSDRTDETAETTGLRLTLSPSGRLHVERDADDAEQVPASLARKIEKAFSRNPATGLLRLGLMPMDDALSQTFFFWKRFAGLFVSEACKINFRTDSPSEEPVFPVEEIAELLDEAPFFHGAEYLNEEAASRIWEGLRAALKEEIAASGSLGEYLSASHSAWQAVGRVCFHLAENRRNPDYPFAFMATCVTGLSKQSGTKHLPLGKAVEEYADRKKKSQLLSLLMPVNNAAKKSPFLKALVDSGRIFHPEAWRPSDALAFLKDIPSFEEAGVMVKVPDWWKSNRPPHPVVKITVGGKKQSQVGLNALMDFSLSLSLPDGEVLTEEDLAALLKSTGQLVQIKGQWIEVDRARLQEVLSHWKTVERDVKRHGLTFAEGLRMLSGMTQETSDSMPAETLSSWSKVEAGKWLREVLQKLRSPEEEAERSVAPILEKHLHAELRPYQQRGVQWLWWLYRMRLGGCLADDMGLGKTIQVISLLLLVKHLSDDRQPSLLVLPATLLGNWQKELARFAPDLSFRVAHASAPKNHTEGLPDDPAGTDLVITTYGTVGRLPWIAETAWNIVLLDEAQAIKNPAARQTKTIKALQAGIRMALTGTPIENRLLDLWSLFDFVAPGLLGASRVFAGYSRQKQKEDDRQSGKFHAAVRQLVSPYILRRLKSDRRIISDLPDKTELDAFCVLTKEQAGLYQQAVDELVRRLQNPMKAIDRRGLVMSYLMRFRQICNHPTQWLGHGDYPERLSGKFLRLRELCETIADKQEKVLVFTQFREIIPALVRFLSGIFQQEGVSLDGQTRIRDREERVALFQQEEGPPYFVLSLKAGGTGLNLTAASHVIHFDRWWNPAVENQATDRAFRIGQKRNVLVHRFICRGTIEEKIAKMLEDKKALSASVIGEGQEVSLTELSDEELVGMVTLDIHRAMADN